MVIVVDELFENSAKMIFGKGNDMVSAFSAKRPDDSFAKGILPRRLSRADHFFDAERFDLLLEDVADLLGGPLRGRILGDVEMNDAPSIVREYDEDVESTLKVNVGTVKKSQAALTSMWLLMKVLQFWREPSFDCFLTMYRSTVDLATSCPSFRSSFRIRGDPQVVLSVEMRLISSMISSVIGGLPPEGARDFRFQ
ncbi:MAG: hypothetical protein V3W41_07615, partial [Planctomycetota bacterium]